MPTATTMRRTEATERLIEAQVKLREAFREVRAATALVEKIDDEDRKR